jgi:hypothetical protein
MILQNPRKDVFEQFNNLLLIPITQMELQEFIINVQKSNVFFSENMYN